MCRPGGLPFGELFPGGGGPDCFVIGGFLVGGPTVCGGLKDGDLTVGGPLVCGGFKDGGPIVGGPVPGATEI